MRAAKGWLASNAAGVKVLRSTRFDAEALACASLVACLPALVDVSLWLLPLDRDDLWCLLEALAWCPRLQALDLCADCFVAGEGDGDLHRPFPYAPSFAKLRSLTKLTMTFFEEPCTLADVVGALMPLTGLEELSLTLYQPAVVPAALGRFKRLQSLAFRGFSPCVLEAGCLDLPNLLILDFAECDFDEDAAELPGIIALQGLMRLEITGREGPRFFDARLVQLPELVELVLSCDIDILCNDDAGKWTPAHLLRLPADMGLLSSSLVHLDISGLRLTQFPLALTQLVALEGLGAGENDFAELSAGITALSRLSTLRLGRIVRPKNFLQQSEKGLLNAVALGDLSGFPALCNLTFSLCEVKLCTSLLGGAMRHASLACVYFDNAHPAPECRLSVLLLSRVRGRSSVVKVTKDIFDIYDDAQALPPFYEFKAALKWCALSDVAL